MELKLSYGLEHGTDRGGEDVWLQVELVTDDPPGDDVGDRAALAFDAWLESAPTTDDAEVWVEDGRVRTLESEYEFCVDRPVEEVRRDVVDLARAGLTPAGEGPFGRHEEWQRSLATGTCRLSFELYRDGNAE